MQPPGQPENRFYLEERFRPEIYAAPVNSVTRQPCMNSLEYAELIIQHQNTAQNYPDAIIGAPDPVEFVEIVNRGFMTLIEERSLEEVEEARDKLIDYGILLREQFLESKFHPESTAYMAWVSKLRVLAGLSEDMQPGVVNVQTPRGGVFNSKRDFWQRIYLETIPSHAYLSQNVEGYLFTSTIDIERKDTVMLGNYIKNLNRNAVEDVFFNSPLVRSAFLLRQESIIQFEQILTQASAFGWKNAREVKAMFDEAEEVHSINPDNVLNWVGNKVTHKINDLVKRKTNHRLQPIDLYDDRQAPIAVQRVMDYIFRLEQPPVDRKAVNYLIIGQIVAKLMEHAAKLPNNDATIHQFRRSTD